MKQSFTPFFQTLTARLSFFLVLLLTSISFSGLAQLPAVPSGYGIRMHSGGGLLAGQQLYGITADPVNGNVYVAASSENYGNQCCFYIQSFNLYRITPAGVVSLVGNYNFRSFEIIKLTWGPDGLIYTRDLATNSIKTINPLTGTSATYATNNLYGQARYALNFDPAGNLIYGFEAMFDFYKVTPAAPIHLGRVTANLPNGNHGDAFGIQPNGNYVVYVDCGGQNNYSINTAAHVAGTSYTSVAWTGTSNLLTNTFYGAAACGYSNGCIDPVTGDVYSTVPNFGLGNSMIVFTPASGGSSSLFVTSAGNGIVPTNSYDQAKGITDMVFGKATNGCGNSLFFTDRYQNKVYEVYKICNQPPAVSCPSNITVNADQGVCGATVTYPAATATGVPAPTITYSHPSGSFFPVGTTTVTVTASNTSGPDATCSFTVTVNGGVDTDGDGTSDVCDTDDDGDGTPDTQDCAPLNAAIHPGATETCNGVDDDCDGTVDDGFINTVVTCPVSGVVTRDIEACIYTVEGAEFNATVTENCGPLGYTLTGATTGTGTSLAGVELNAGETMVTWSATNAAGQAVSSSFTVKVVPPAPNLTCPENITVTAPQGQCGAVVTYTAPSAPQACNDIPATLVTLNYTGSVVNWTVPQGVTSISVEAFGAQGGGNAGGKGARIKGNISVTPGEELKIMIGGQGGVTSQGQLYCAGGGGGTFVYRNASDPFPLIAAGGGGGQSEFSFGAAANGGEGSGTLQTTNGVSYSGNAAGGVDGNGGSGGLDVGDYSTGGGGAGWITDGSNGLLLRNPAGQGGKAPRNGGAGGIFTHYYGFTGANGGFGGGGSGSDNTGAGGGGGGFNGGGGGNNYLGSGRWGSGGGGGSYNSGTDQQNVTGVRSGNGLVTITYGTASYTVTQTAGLASGATFPVGETTNTFEINDGNGNISTCSFIVTVKDEEAPTISCPGNIAVDAAAGECAAAVSFLATAADNCSATVTYYLHYGDAELRTAIDDSYAFPIGVHTVTAVAKDASGNEVTCSFTVTVNDVTPPTFTCPQGQEVAMDNNCQITVPNLISALQGADQCGQVSFTQAPVAGTLLNAVHNGTYNVTITATDESNNETSCTVTLTAKDVTAPTFTCPENRTVNLDANCAITVPDLVTGLTGSDYCGQVTFTQSPLAGTVINATHGSTHTVTITAADGNGNTTNCTVTLSAADVTPPVLQEPAGITQNTDAGQCGASVSITTPGATDNCAGVQVVGVRNDAQALTAQYPVGTTVITWTATDAAGLTDTYEQTITISDKENPLVTCPQPVTVVNDAGVCRAGNVVIGVATATDACGIRSVVGVRSDQLALDAAYPVGTTTITWTATDNNGNTASCTQAITVSDNEVPHVITKNITRQLSQAGTVTITAADVNNGSWDNCGVQSLSVSPGSFNCTHIGPNTVTLTVTDVHGNVNTATAEVTITPMVATTTVNVNPASQQYSDDVTFSATVSPAILQGGCEAATHVTFTLGGRVMGKVPLALNEDGNVLVGVLHTSLYEIDNTGSVAPGSKTVKATFSGVNPAFTVPEATTTLTITAENAAVEYTGTPFVSTPNVAISSPVTITVPLRMSVQDISAVAGSGDARPGNISRAKARFVLRETGQLILGPGADSQGWIPVSLINLADSSLGTVALDWQATLASNDYSEEYTIDLEVGGPGSYYRHYDANDKTVVTISRPAMDFVTGGGTILPGTVSGQYAPAAGKKINFGFNLKYNKSGKNLQGSANIVYRMVVNGETRVFQIKGNSMTAMGVNTSISDAKQGSFVCKANLVDVTNPLAPVSYGGGHTLEVSGTDKGEPGTNDQLAITLYTSKGALLFSSNWSNRKTAEKQIASGNVVVSGGGVATGQQVSPELAAADKAEKGVGRLTINVLPNPSATQFTLVVQSARTESVDMRIVDRLGRVMETRSNVAPNSSITIGSHYRPGIYIVEVVQGAERVEARLVKMSH